MVWLKERVRCSRHLRSMMDFGKWENWFLSIIIDCSDCSFPNESGRAFRLLLCNKRVSSNASCPKESGRKFRRFSCE